MNYEKLITKHKAQDKTYYIKVVWRRYPHDLFQIFVINEDVSWSGVFTLASANQFRENYTEYSDEYQYHEEVKSTFKEINENFEYDFNSFKENPSLAKFIWRKKIGGNRVMQGSVDVVKDNEPMTRDSLIDDLLEENKTLSELNDRRLKIAVERQSELDRCKYMVREYADIKKTVEETLYGKFIQILNTKKQRIKLLEEQLQKLGISDDVNSDTE